MNKILYIDDDRLIDTPKLELDHRMSVAAAYRAFSDEYVYDIVSLDGRMPLEVPETDAKEFDEFINSHTKYINRNKPLWTEVKYRDVRFAGVYLLYLMKKFNYVPKILLLHSYDANIRFIMEDIVKKMFYDKPILTMFMDKRYIFDSESVDLIQQGLDKQKHYFKDHNEADVYVKLEKGKNYFIVTPEKITFAKKSNVIDSRPMDNVQTFIRQKICEGYDITHGVKYLTNPEYMRTDEGAHFYGAIEFKPSPIHF